MVVDVAAGVPTILHWGAPLGGSLPPRVAFGDSRGRAVVPGGLDAEAPLSVVPEHGSGFPGRPGLLGHRRGGTHWSPRFEPDGADAVEVVHHADGGRLVARAIDEVASLVLVTTIELDHVLRVWIELTNLADTRYLLDGLTVTLPLPDQAGELLSFEGRWARELGERRVAWTHGSWTAENRSGRTSHEHPPLLFAGTIGFGEWHGEVWGVHLAWSGNHVMLAERLPDGRRYAQLGELVHPGELALEPGETYRTPDVVAVHSTSGLTPATWGFHRHLRGLPSHPATPRPVIVNTWEAVYFDHDPERLGRLASLAAEVGAERFVLDDGWFGGRRDDSRGLGDWWVSPEAHPDGLGPLIDHVRALGMELGIWVEPEMVNPDSELARAHPDWALTTDGYDPVLGRNQLVLDLTIPEAFTEIHDRLDALLSDHDIAFVKWDMNRPHVQGSLTGGAAGSHAQTLAVHRLLDALRARHPGVEFETCASGGGRVDAAILRRVERVWTSDCNDPLERQRIQRAASMLLPPEVMGCHIGPPRAHTTGRRHRLAFRAVTALFGHLGIEWDLTTVDQRDLDALAAVVALHRAHRRLLHGGDAVRFDVEPPLLAHGVYGSDRSEALVCVAQLDTAPWLVPPRVRLPGLAADTVYHVRHVPLPGERWGSARHQPSWLAEGIDLTGRHLGAVGIQPPVLDPESAVLFHLASVTANGAGPAAG